MKKIGKTQLKKIEIKKITKEDLITTIPVFIIIGFIALMIANRYLTSQQAILLGCSIGLVAAFFVNFLRTNLLAGVVYPGWKKFFNLIAFTFVLCTAIALVILAIDSTSTCVLWGKNSIGNICPLEKGIMNL